MTRLPHADPPGVMTDPRETVAHPGAPAGWVRPRTSAERRVPAGESPYLLVALGCLLALTTSALVWLATQGLLGLSVTIGCLLAALTVWIGVPIWRRRRRAREVRRWTVEHGWRPDDAQTRSVLGGTEVLHGLVDAIPVTSCTTEYDPDWRRGADTTRFRHLLMSSLDVDFPVLTMVPTGGVNRPPAGPVDGPDLQFESADFNARWRVQCVDPQFAHAFCHPRLMERLLRPDVAGLSVLIAGGDVAVHAPGATALDDIEARAAVVADLLRLVPPRVLVDHGSWAPPARRVPTALLRGAPPGETTGWPTVVMTAVVLAGVAWFVVTMARAGEVGFALGTVGVVATIAAVPVLSSRAARRRRLRQSRRWDPRQARPASLHRPQLTAPAQPPPAPPQPPAPPAWPHPPPQRPPADPAPDPPRPSRRSHSAAAPRAPRQSASGTRAA